MQQRKQERTMREERTIIKSHQVSLSLQLSQSSSLILFHAVASTNRKKPRPSERESQVMGFVLLPDMDLDALHKRISSNPPSNHIWEPGMIEEAHRQGIETHRNSFAILQNGAAVDGLLAEDDKAKEARGRQRSMSARESALLHPPSTKRSKLPHDRRSRLRKSVNLLTSTQPPKYQSCPLPLTALRGRSHGETANATQFS